MTKPEPWKESLALALRTAFAKPEPWRESLELALQTAFAEWKLPPDSCTTTPPRALEFSDAETREGIFRNGKKGTA